MSPLPKIIALLLLVQLVPASYIDIDEADSTNSTDLEFTTGLAKTTVTKLLETSTTPTTTTTSRPLECECELRVNGYSGDLVKKVNVEFVTSIFVRGRIFNSQCSDVKKCGSVCSVYAFKYMRNDLDSQRSQWDRATVGDYLCGSIGRAVDVKQHANVTYVAHIGGCASSYTVKEMSSAFCCSKNRNIYEQVACGNLLAPNATVKSTLPTTTIPTLNTTIASSTTPATTTTAPNTTTPTTTTPTTTTSRPTTIDTSTPQNRRCKCELWVNGYYGNLVKKVNVNFVTLQFVRGYIYGARCSEVAKCGEICTNYAYNFLRNGVDSPRTRFDTETIGDYLCGSVRRAVDAKQHATVSFVAQAGGCTNSYTVREMSSAFCCSKNYDIYKQVACSKLSSPDAIVG